MFVVCEFEVESQSLYFGLMFMESVMLSICNSSCVLYSAGSGVKRVHVFYLGLERGCVSMYIGCLLLLCLCRCVLMFGDGVYVCREFYWCMWCVRCVYVEKYGS